MGRPGRLTWDHVVLECSYELTGRILITQVYWAVSFVFRFHWMDILTRA